MVDDACVVLLLLSELLLYTLSWNLHISLHLHEFYPQPTDLSFEKLFLRSGQCLTLLADSLVVILERSEV